MTRYEPDPEFVEYLESEVRNPNLSAATVMRMERVFIDQRNKYEAKLQAAPAQDRRASTLRKQAEAVDAALSDDSTALFFDREYVRVQDLEEYAQRLRTQADELEHPDARP